MSSRTIVLGSLAKHPIAIRRFDYFDGGIWKGREYHATVYGPTACGAAFGATRAAAIRRACNNLRRLVHQASQASGPEHTGP